MAFFLSKIRWGLRTSNQIQSILRSSAKKMSSSENLTIDVDDKTGVATMKMCKAPVNSLNLDFLTEISIALEKLENEKCKGLILTSGQPKVYSAGLDIMEMYNPQMERLRLFWSTLQDVWVRLYGSKMACIAAINGHSPAGGCLLAMCCDYRVMASGFTIGLNETKLGIVAPFWFKDTMVNLVGPGITEYSLQLGKMYSSEEALKAGLVNEVVSPEAVLDTATKQMAEWIKIPYVARQLTKDMMRRGTIEKLLMRKEEDIVTFKEFCMKSHVQKNLGIYIESLKNKKKS